ncbi:MAG: DUF4372 domain-containing protein [Proteobacteria bacterium]|nr:DUF4372 domain-containing protein [Pseudomonadota bacterium]
MVHRSIRYITARASSFRGDCPNASMCTFQLDRKYGQGDRRRKTSRYIQLIVMLMAQILGLKSLREIEQAQKSKRKRLFFPILWNATLIPR